MTQLESRTADFLVEAQESSDTSKVKAQSEQVRLKILSLLRRVGAVVDSPLEDMTALATVAEDSQAFLDRWAALETGVRRRYEPWLDQAIRKAKGGSVLDAHLQNRWHRE
jgi:hypothetical protein